MNGRNRTIIPIFIAACIRSVDEIKAYLATPGIYRPFILCEYLHAMGNSCGGMKEYWDVFESNSGWCKAELYGIG